MKSEISVFTGIFTDIIIAIVVDLTMKNKSGEYAILFGAIFNALIYSLCLINAYFIVINSVISVSLITVTIYFIFDGNDMQLYKMTAIFGYIVVIYCAKCIIHLTKKNGNITV